MHRSRPLLPSFPVTSASRRVRLYWLLLLFPALAVGAGTLLLLRRETVRLDEQTRAVLEAQREALEARARVAAENVELLLADVQAALMQTLSDVPPAGVQTYLSEWQSSNLLVADAFFVDPAGTWRQGGAASEAWSRAALWDREAQRMKAEAESEQRKRAEVYQRARSAAQEVARQRNALPASAPAAATSRAADFAMEARPADLASGWSRWNDGSTWHVFGWRRRADGAVVGLELALDELYRRARGVVAPMAEEGSMCELQPGASPATATTSRNDGLLTVRHPVAPDVLPAWEIVARSDAAALPRSSGQTLFVLGGLLVTLLTGAIAVGGRALLREARRTEEEAAQKTSFVANVSHELRTPLTTIRLYAELLHQGRVTDRDRQIEYLATIGRESERLGRLVNDVLDFSRLEQGQKQFTKTQLDLGAEIAGMVSMQTPSLEAAGLEVELTTPADPLVLETDRDAIQQIVLNLLDNVAKYAADGREVSITVVRRSPHGAEITVADRGPGVPAALRQAVFERFRRLDESLTATRSGAGLGLSIARALARGLGGDLECRSRSGGGAEFVLLLK